MKPWILDITLENGYLKVQNINGILERTLLMMLYNRTEKVANDDEKKALKALKESYLKGWQVTEMEPS